MVRLQKFLAEAGVASRRAGEQLITSRRVAVNGKVVTELGTKVDPVGDKVTLDGTPLHSRPKSYIAFNKPAGVITTRADERGRRTIYDYLHEKWASLVPVGRLDRQSEGLIFLTNDGDFCLKLTHPRYRVRKCYRAVVEGRVHRPMLRQFLDGVQDAGEILKAERVRLVDANNTHSVVELELSEGKNREVRRLFEVIGLKVCALQRTQIGRIRIGEMRSGHWRTLTPPEIKSLLTPS